MSASRAWTLWHLTPRGWEHGNEKKVWESDDQQKIAKLLVRFGPRPNYGFTKQD